MLLRWIKVLAVSVLFIVLSHAQDNICRVAPGGHTVVVPLGPITSPEPLCQPARIRVDDRGAVTLRLTGLSPLDVCTITPKTPTITTVVNPIEGFINNVSALKSFAIGGSSQKNRFSTLAESMLPGPPSPDNRETQFKVLAERFDQQITKPDNVFQKQAVWLAYYQNDVNVMGQYASANYRGTLYTSFQPITAPELAPARQHALPPPMAGGADPTALNFPPTESDYAELQSILDQMTVIGGGFSDICSKLPSPTPKTPPNPKDPPPPTCNLNLLKLSLDAIDRAKSVVAVASDNLKTLQTAQATVATNYNLLLKALSDFNFRKDNLHTVAVSGGVLVQDVPLGPDYGATDSGTVGCVSSYASTQQTTDPINYSILYQSVPRISASAGLLASFQQKRVIGTASHLNADGTTGNAFVITDSSRAQAIPMGFFNVRVGNALLRNWWLRPEDELIITYHLTAGIGVNSNTGTNQPEFFVGNTVAFNRIDVHVGAHFGRTQSLGGNFQLNSQLPAGFSGSAPINWSYHPALALGVSVRFAPF